DAARSSAFWLASVTSAAPGHSLRSSGNGGQLPAARFREQHGGDEEQRVRGRREQPDGAPERHGGGEEPDHAGKERADPAAEVVAESLARSADAGGEELGEEGAHPAEDAAGEEAEGKAEDQHGAVADGDQRVDEDGGHRAEGEEVEVPLAAEVIGEVRAHQVAAERSGDDHAQ